MATELTDKSKVFLDGVRLGRKVGEGAVELSLLRTFEQAVIDKDEDLKERCLTTLTLLRELIPALDE